jgi:HAD superfamily hydrolase (TIGR01549 family)
MRYDALLFDNDGVLLRMPPDDRDAFDRAIQQAFQAHGVRDPAAEHVTALMYGVSVSDVEAICDEYGLEREALWRSRNEHCARVQREAIAADEKGLYPDVEVLHDLSGPLGVVSTNQQATLEFAFERLEVPSFDTVHGRPMTIESLQRKKPAPYYIEAALDALGASTAVYVGDSEHDVVAATQAGIDSAFLRREHNADASLSVEPTYELHGLEELEGILSGEPAR